VSSIRRAPHDRGRDVAVDRKLVTGTHHRRPTGLVEYIATSAHANAVVADAELAFAVFDEHPGQRAIDASAYGTARPGDSEPLAGTRLKERFGMCSLECEQRRHGSAAYRRPAAPALAGIGFLLSLWTWSGGSRCAESPLQC
jgi:hypothetical protein